MTFATVPSPPIRVLIADDHPLMREALSTAIGDEPDMRVVGQAADGVAVVHQALTLKPDVIVMDLFMPGQSGLEAIVAIKRLLPDARLLVLTSASADDMVLSAVQAGVLGYLVKDCQRGELLDAIRAVSRGNPYLPLPVAAKLAQALRARSVQHTASPVEPLTDREKDVLRLLGRGASNREIAEQLHISQGTVRTHVHHILGKLGLANRNQALLYALREKQVDSGPQA